MFLKCFRHKSKSSERVPLKFLVNGCPDGQASTSGSLDADTGNFGLKRKSLSSSEDENYNFAGIGAIQLPNRPSIAELEYADNEEVSV